MHKDLTLKITKYFYFVFIVLFVAFIFSCKTNEVNNSSINTKEYSEEDFINNKISEINKLFESKKNILKPFWYSYLLATNYVNDISSQNYFISKIEIIKKELDSLYEKKNWIEFCNLYNSAYKIISYYDKDLLNEMDFISYDEKYNLAKNKTTEHYRTNLLPANNSRPEKISKMIDGTVTVWLDLGIKIEGGKAFANNILGSGFFIDKRGYLITNYHVISSQVDPKYEGISRLYVRFGNDVETKIPAKVVGYDKSLDLALLKTEVPPEYVFALGSSSDLDIGDKIYAIGSPVGLERTLTSGIVSAQGRQLFSIATVMQIDAAINMGNSGGPIIDENGNVQAIVFAGMLEFEGLNFAIPVEYLELLLPRLYNGGEVKHPWIGIFAQNNKDGGIEILWTETGSSAKFAGLLPGNVIIGINGKEVKNIDQLHLANMLVLPDSIAEYSLIDKDGNKKDVLVYTEIRAENPGYNIYKKESVENYFYPLFGMELERNSTLFKNKFLVKSVVKGSVADDSGFREFDPVQVMRTEVTDEKNILMAEIYSKKQSNGYLDISMIIGTPLDSEKFF